MENDINELLKDKKFVEKILIMKTPEEIQKAFSDRGVKISIEELKEIAKNVSQIINSSNPKEKIINIESEMDNISGGKINVHKGLRTAAAVIAGAGVGGGTMYLAYKAGKAIDSANQAINTANKIAENANQAVSGVRSGFFGWLFGMSNN